MISDISTHSWRVFVYTLYNFTYTIHFQHTLDIFSVLSECISSYFDICYRISTYSFLCLLHSVAMDPGPGSKAAAMGPARARPAAALGPRPRSRAQEYIKYEKNTLEDIRICENHILRYPNLF